MTKMSEEGGERTRLVPDMGGDHPPPPPPNYYYGTFQGVANYYQPQTSLEPQPAVGFPQPPGSLVYSNGYQTVPGYAIVHQPLRQDRLPCCGLGIGWFLFISGFFLGAIPWYIGAFLLICVHLDYREKPGLIACSIAALLAVLAVSLGVSKATRSW